MSWILSLLLAAGLRAEPIVRPGEAALRAQAPIVPAALQLPALPELKADAVSQIKLPDAQFPRKDLAVDPLQQAVQMSAQGTGGPSEPGQWWDHERRFEKANEEELVYVERARKKQEAVQHAHAGIPALDYRRNRFNKEDAEEFLAEGENGKFLELVLTPHAVDLDVPLDPSRVDMTLFGKSEADLRALLEAKDIAPWAYHDFLGKAFNYGLVYRVHDAETRKTYHGIPHHVRSALGLAAPEARKPSEKTQEPKSARLAPALKSLAREAEALPPKEELFEFTAQVVEAAIKTGVFKREDLSEKFEERSLSIDFDAPSLPDALLTLLESSHGTPWFDKALHLCRQAVADGSLTKSALEDSLRNL